MISIHLGTQPQGCLVVVFQVASQTQGSYPEALAVCMQPTSDAPLPYTKDQVCHLECAPLNQVSLSYHLLHSPTNAPDS